LLVRIEFDMQGGGGGNGSRGTAREAARYNMRERIRAVEQGPDGAIWVLEDSGRLLKLTAR
jgi:glucose/arabinose dehydrogenase